MVSFNRDDINQAVQSLNEDLSSIDAWSKYNSLVLNPSKSKYLILGSKKQISVFSQCDDKVEIAGVPIERVYGIHCT